MSSGRALLALGFILTANGIAQNSGNEFEKKVRSVFAARCQVCHNAQLKTAGLDLSSAQGFQQGGPSGALISPDQPSSSLLLKVISYEERMKMPPIGKLAAEEIAAHRMEAGAMAGAAASDPRISSCATTGRTFTEIERAGPFSGPRREASCRSQQF
jgi:hypothetical protein